MLSPPGQHQPVRRRSGGAQGWQGRWVVLWVMFTGLQNTILLSGLLLLLLLLLLVLVKAKGTHRADTNILSSQSEGQEQG